MRRFVRPLLNLVICGGLLLAAWPVGQTLYGRWSQRALAAQWQQEQAKAPQPKPSHGKTGRIKTASHAKTGESTPKIRATLVKSSNASPTMSVASSAKPKPWPLTKLSIPDIGLETFIVQGWDDAALRRGPGHFPQSSLAGEGNCVVAGHRNIYGSPFYKVEELLPGATITLSNRNGTFNYTVNSVFATPDTNVQILGPIATGEVPRLTIVSCTMPHTNNRVIVQALLSG